MRSILFACLCLINFACYAEDDFTVPEGYVLQRLEATDGRIARPKDWFYTNGGTPSGWVWTFSKEDPSKGGYETGFRIQLLVGIKEKTGQSPEAFAQNFLLKKKLSAKVIKDCPTDTQDDFMRQCLEVIEDIQRPKGMTTYHILYSVFWGRKLDMVVVNTLGAPEEEWQSIIPINDVMSHVVLIGPNLGK